VAEYDAETELRLAEVRLGIQAEDFLRSPIGRYLVGRAQIEVEAAVEELKHAHPEDPAIIRKLQNRITLMESFGAWLQDAIANGNNAEAQLKHQEGLEAES
jgi:hypothetical protein